MYFDVRAGTALLLYIILSVHAYTHFKVLYNAHQKSY